MKPSCSAPVAPAAALAVSCSVVCPPGGIVTAGGTEIVAPGVAACGATSTCHVPPPPPASLSATRTDRLAGPLVTGRSPNDSDCGSEKNSGESAAARFASPAPWMSTDDSDVRLESAHAGPAVDMSADLICFGVHPG